MDILIKVLWVAVPLAYVATNWICFRLFQAEDEEAWRDHARRGLIIALVAHTAFLFAIAAEHHRCPLATRGEGLLFGAWMLAILHLISARLAGTSTLGAFTMLPATIGVCASVFLLKSDFGFPPKYQSSYFIFHIVASLTSYISFCIATVLAVSYLVLYRRLKQKQFDTAFFKIPPLEKLDALCAAWTMTGSAAMLIGSAIGWIWMRQEAVANPGASLFPILGLLAVFIGAGIARRTANLRGRRYAVVVIAAFVLAVLVLSINSFHGFYR
tara:strand:- start:47 stop:856 length:810 start_codon:yes stop_codon:yes gene_type:complete